MTTFLATIFHIYVYMKNNLQNKLKLYHRYNMFLQKISVKYRPTCTLVRIYTNTHIPIDTCTLIMFMFKPYNSFHSPAINIYILDIYIYILTPALVTLEDGFKPSVLPGCGVYVVLTVQHLIILHYPH